MGSNSIHHSSNSNPHTFHPHISFIQLMGTSHRELVGYTHNRGRCRCHGKWRGAMEVIPTLYRARGGDWGVVYGGKRQYDNGLVSFTSFLFSFLSSLAPPPPPHLFFLLQDIFTFSPVALYNPILHLQTYLFRNDVFSCTKFISYTNHPRLWGY